MSGHWVFGIKYAEVVLKLPMLVFPEEVVDIKAKMNKISWVVWTLNGFFGALNFTYTILLQFYLYDDWNNMAVLLIGTYIAIALAPTVILLASVIKVRLTVRKMSNKAIFQKEKVILLHTIVFSLFFIFDITQETTINAAQSSEDVSKKCKETITGLSADICYGISNGCIFVLITYMSVQFCKPLGG